MTSKGQPTRYWTAEEDRLLEEHAGTNTVAQMAALLGRTPSSISNRCHRLGVRLVDGRTTEAFSDMLSAFQLARKRRRADIGLTGLPTARDAELLTMLDQEFEL